MNSAIPISNLSGMVYETLMDKNDNFNDFHALDKESREEIKQSLQTIKHRSKGLVNFVNSTKKITKLPLPEFQDTEILALAKRVFSLYAGKLKEKRIYYTVKSQTNHTVQSADPEQIEQVFINLLQNAIDATAKCASPEIHLNIETITDNRLIVTFSDNGKGMTNEEKDQVFIPYFTTKKKGTGIGMTISRQIIHNHQGNMEVYSEPGKGTEIRIIFRSFIS
jgi:signal transduction histidine kinase